MTCTTTDMSGSTPTALADYPPMSVTARRRALCELADLYAVEQVHNQRPLTDAIPALLPPLCAAHVTVHRAIDLFDRFSRARAAVMSAGVGPAAMEMAERRAEHLLDQLVGEGQS